MSLRVILGRGDGQLRAVVAGANDHHSFVVFISSILDHIRDRPESPHILSLRYELTELSSFAVILTAGWIYRAIAFETLGDSPSTYSGLTAAT